jgi:hypothetical protein
MSVCFAYFPSVPNGRRDANAAANQALGLPEHRGAGRLAVVGGGSSINDHIEELRNFRGTIWAVNGTINWCLDHGIDAYFYTIDAQPIENWTYDLSRIDKAVLAIDCDPSLFEKLKGADVSTLVASDGGPTSANSADLLSLQAGYVGVTFYGCESSFGESTHAYQSHPVPGWIDVRVGGETYRTKPEFLEQARVMAEVIRTIPKFYSERSGGLLRAMVKHSMDYELIAVSHDVAARLIDRRQELEAIGA